jgi:hypothetical protein
VEPGADDAPLGAIDVGAEGANPPTRRRCRESMKWLGSAGHDSSMLRPTTPGDTVPALGSSGAMDLGVARFLLPSYLGSTFPPVN